MDDAGVRILGLDPGLRVTGYGIIEITGTGVVLCEAGVIRPSDRMSLETRLRELFDSACELIQTWKPAVAALEEVFSHAFHPQTAVLMGHARGVICLSCALAGVPVKHYSATQVKKMLSGSGRATKSQIQRALSRELNLEKLVEPPDVADALALALCHYHISRRQQMLGMTQRTH